MPTITFRPDDSGIQTLKKENAGEPARTVGTLQPANPVRAIHEQDGPPLPPQVQTPRYKGPERRREERRKSQTQVILDTRGKQERRRQPPEAADTDDAPRVGIDIYG